MTKKPVRLLAVLAFLMIGQTSEHAQRPSMPRIPLLDPSAWTSAQHESLGTMDRGARTTNPFKICVRNPELCRNWLTFGRYVSSDASTLPRRDRELLVLRTAWLDRDDYLWSEHSRSALNAGFTAEDLSNITKGPRAGWSSSDAALIQAADELHATQFVSDATWKALARRYDDRQLLDTVFLVGEYTMVSMFLKSAGVPLEEEYKGLPR